MTKPQELLGGIFLSIFLFVIFFLLSVPEFSGDVKNHIVWGESILTGGTKGFYGREFKDYSFPNYPPLSMLSFAGSVWLYRFTSELFFNLNAYPVFPSELIPWIENENVKISFLKIPAIVPFILTGWIIYFFGLFFKKNKKQSFLFTLLFIFNPGLFYLSVVWGQNDFMQVFFILGAFYLLLKERFMLSYFFAGFSILSKQTVLMLWGLFLITVYKNNGFAKSKLALVASLIIFWLAYLPFNNSSFSWPFTFYNETLSKSTGFLVSDNAINFWGVYSGFKQLDASIKFLSLSYEKWGFLVFGVLILPLLYKYLKTKFSINLMLRFLFISSIAYFFILTRMHERYLFFGVIFAHLLTMLSIKYWYSLVFFSGFYFINLYRGLYLPDIAFLTPLVENELFLTILAIGYLLLLGYNYYLFMFKLSNETE